LEFLTKEEILLNLVIFHSKVAAIWARRKSLGQKLEWAQGLLLKILEMGIALEGFYNLGSLKFRTRIKRHFQGYHILMNPTQWEEREILLHLIEAIRDKQEMSLISETQRCHQGVN
jgi:hypothetical protein